MPRALDTASSAEVMAVLKNLHRDKGVTLVIVTHERDIAAWCDREVVMRDGRVISDGRQQNTEKGGPA